MKVRIRLFAAAKELAETDELLLDVAPGSNIGALRAAIIEAKPSLARLVPHSLWAIGAEYVDDKATLNENSDVALIPPVSGG